MSTVPSNLVPTPISQLPTIPGVPTTADQLMVVQNGNTYRAPLGSLIGVVTVPSNRAVYTGTGLQGGGTLAANLTLSLANTGVTAGTYGSSSLVPILSINAQGQVTSVSTSSFSVSFSSITGKPTTLSGYGIIDAQPLNSVLTGLSGVGTSGLFVQTAYGTSTTRSIVAGTGMSVSNGNGISGNPTVSISNTGVVAGEYGSVTQVPTFIVNAQGQITSIGQNTPTVAWSQVTSTPTTLAGYGITDAVPNSRTVSGQYSITGGGPLSSNITLNLVGDTSVPGLSKYYGTDNSGTRGWYTLSGGGSVTSVGLSMPSDFSVASSPITSSGTLTVTYAIQASNKIFAGPSSGASATPTFRSLVAADLPNTGVSASTYGSSYQVPVIAIDAQGRITSAANTTIDAVTLTTGTISTTPTNATDIANKGYVDAVAQGLNVKAAAAWATTANITLSGLGTQAGGEWTTTLTAGDRILVKNQSTQANNGIYSASSSAWTRTTDADTWNELVSAFVFVQKGATLGDTGWVCTVDPGGTLGVTAVTWAQFSGAGTYLAGTGLTLTGNTFSITDTTVTANPYGSSTAIPTFTVNAQGQLTAASTAAVIAPAGTLSGTTLNSTVVTSSLTSVGTIGTGTWQGTIVSPTYGGTGINNGSATLTMAGNITHSGAFTQTFVATGNTSVTLPTSGTLVNTAVTTLSSLSSIGTIATGTWNGTAIGATYGGTGQTTYAIGDVLYASSTTALSKLPMGTTGQVLVATTGGSPSWAGVPSTAAVTSISFGSTGLTPATATAGAVTVAGTLAVANGGTGVTISSGASSVVLRDASANITGNSFLAGFTNTAASGTQITLTAASTPVYSITGSGGQVIQLPNATTLSSGTIFSFNNNQSSGAITVNNNSGTLVASIPSGSYVTIVLLSNASTAGSWDRHDQTPSNVSWSTNTLDYAGSITSATWNGVVVATNRGGTGLSTFTAANNAIYSTSSSALTAGTLPVLAGGTGATTISGAQTNLQVDPAGTAVAMSIALG